MEVVMEDEKSIASNIGTVDCLHCFAHMATVMKFEPLSESTKNDCGFVFLRCELCRQTTRVFITIRGKSLATETAHAALDAGEVSSMSVPRALGVVVDGVKLVDLGD